MGSMRLKLSRRWLVALITLLLAGFALLLWQLTPPSYALWGGYGGLTLALVVGRLCRIYAGAGVADLALFAATGPGSAGAESAG
jgi:hypothetical protein